MTELKRSAPAPGGGGAGFSNEQTGHHLVGVYSDSRAKLKARLGIILVLARKFRRRANELCPNCKETPTNSTYLRIDVTTGNL